MTENAGILVTYIDLHGKKQKAIVRHSEQNKILLGSGRYYVRLLNDDFTEKLDKESGKKVVGCVKISRLTQIGFVD